MDLSRVPGGTRVFVDASIFVYHFTGVSKACRRFLDRCERGELQGVTSVTVIAEATHRLMMIEAVQAGVVSHGNVAAKLRRKPNVIRALRITEEQVARIPMMGMQVLDLDLRLLSAAADVRRAYGLMTNDSILLATALSQKIAYLATANRDFEAVASLTVLRPGDLPRVSP